MSLAPKTQAVATGGGISGAFALVLVWVLGQFGVDMPAEVAAAVGVLVTGVGAFAQSWLAPRA